MARALGKAGGRQLRSQSCYTDKFCPKWRSHWASDRDQSTTVRGLRGLKGVQQCRRTSLRTIFQKDFQGSPETASAATAWFASMGVNLVGRGGNPTVQPQRLGNCGSGQAHLAY